MTATILSPSNPGSDQSRRADAAESAPAKRKDASREGAESAPFDGLLRSFAAAIPQMPLLAEQARPNSSRPVHAADNKTKPASEAQSPADVGTDRAAAAPKLRLITRAGEAARGELGLAAHADPTRAATDRLASSTATPNPLGQESAPVEESGSTRAAIKAGDASGGNAAGEGRGSSARTSSDAQHDAPRDQRPQGDASQASTVQRGAGDAARGTSNESGQRDGQVRAATAVGAKPAAPASARRSPGPPRSSPAPRWSVRRTSRVSRRG